jgi:hypothetical protein
MENEINEQTKIVNDLRTLGASSNTITHEERRLEELQALCYKYFRRDMIQKWKRPSNRSMLKNSNRSKSFVVPSPTYSHVSEKNLTLDTIMADDESGQQDQSRGKGTLRVKIPQRVTFNDSMRQSSLPSADSDISFSEGGMEWPSVHSVPEAPDSINIDGDEVELRRKPIAGNVQPQKQQEPNIDFELDIKVLVNSGKCVLHTKEQPQSDDKTSTTSSSTSNVRQHKRERSLGTDFSSPILSRRSKEKLRLKYNPPGHLIDLTIFHIPGLDVKLHYESKTLVEEPARSFLNSDVPTR